MRSRPAIALLAAAGVGGVAGCGPGPCKSCPSVGGNWTMNIVNFTLSPNSNCSWSTGSFPITVVQSPPTTSSATIMLGAFGPIGLGFYSLVVPCTIYQNDEMTGSVTNRSQSGSFSETETDALSLNLSSDAASFTGTWTSTISDTDSSVSPPDVTTCTGTAQLTGQKQ